MRDTPAPGPVQANQRRWPVRLILFGVVFALVLPGLLFCGILLRQIATTERSRSMQAVQGTALRIADTLDRELANTVAALVALGTSPALDSGDLVAFDSQERAVATALGHPITLATPGAPAPGRAQTGPEALARAVETGKPAISGLVPDPGGRGAALTIDVPVFRDGRVRAVLVATLRPQAVTDLLLQQNLPSGWLATVIDADDRVFARTSGADRFLGQLAPDDFRRKAPRDRAVWIGESLDGQRVLAATQGQRLADWRVIVGIPLDDADSPLRRTITLLAITGSVTLVIACVLAWKLADSVADPLRRLARAGQAATDGLPVPGIRSSIAEVHAVSRALAQATRDLRSRADLLAAERARLAAIIDTVPVGILIATMPDGRIVSGNGYLEHLLRRSLQPGPDGTVSVCWTARHPDGRAVAPAEFPLARALKGEAHPELECLVQRDDGTELWIRVVGAPVRAADGRIAGGLVAVLDIDEAVRARDATARFAERLEALVDERTTALRQANQRLRDEMAGRTAAEEQLRQAQKMEAVGQLTGGIAHDFNNLLTIVIGSLDLLRRRLPDDAAGERARRLVDNAFDGATRAATLTARLLAFSRRQPLSPQPVDANHLVEGMVDLLTRTLGDAMQVETRLAPGLWQSHADPNQLENALLNLAVNARDAMRAAQHGDGRLAIETANAVLDPAQDGTDPDVAPGEYVAVSVTDNGTGMPPEIAARVFEPFYTTKRPGQGTGLGLSQVHGFVKQSGGHIALRSAPGAGTTLTIYLPRFTGAPAAPAALPPPPAPLPRPPLVVLLVEDEAAVRRVSAAALRELGHTVFEAGDPAAALRLLDARPDIALLFTDVVLPAMNGVSLAEAARRRRPGLPVLFTSGYTGELAGQYAGLGAEAPLLSKPFTVPQLAAKLEEAMRPAGLEPATKPL